LTAVAPRWPPAVEPVPATASTVTLTSRLDAANRAGSDRRHEVAT
jgi:hypothetical protein